MRIVVVALSEPQCAQRRPVERMIGAKQSIPNAEDFAIIAVGLMVLSRIRKSQKKSVERSIAGRAATTPSIKRASTGG